MGKKRIEFIVGIFVVAGFICIGYLTVRLGKMELWGGNYYKVYAKFSSVSGLRTGAVIEMAGVRIGQVKSIELDDITYAALVEMNIYKDLFLSEDVIASIKTAGIIGDKYIKLSQGGSDIDLKDGDMITETESALDIEELISKYAFGGLQTMNAKKILSSIVPIILFFSSTLFAAEPMETLQGLFDKGISIIEDSNSSYNEKADNRDYLWSVINQLFDFKQISILAVGPMWRSFTEEQKKEFVEVFTEFLGNTYLDKIEEAYDHDKIDYLKQNIINEKKALVSTQVIRKNAVIPVNYGMINVNGEWKVYDVKLEGVSLVQNYRNQFAKILLNDSPDILIQRIKAKNVE